jgi:hypothetical protein
MIKKVGAELDRSPKRLRSIMENHNNTLLQTLSTPRQMMGSIVGEIKLPLTTESFEEKKMSMTATNRIFSRKIGTPGKRIIYSS